MKTLAIFAICILCGCALPNGPKVKEIGLSGAIPPNLPANAATTLAFAEEVARAWRYPGLKLATGERDASEVSRVGFPRRRISAAIYSYHPERELTVKLYGDIKTPEAEEMAEIAKKIALEKFGIVLYSISTARDIFGSVRPKNPNEATAHGDANRNSVGKTRPTAPPT